MSDTIIAPTFTRAQAQAARLDELLAQMVEAGSVERAAAIHLTEEAARHLARGGAVRLRWPRVFGAGAPAESARRVA